MFKVFVLVIEILSAVLVVSQVILPIIIPNTRFFWLFRKPKSDTKETVQSEDDLRTTLDSTKEEVANTKKKVQDVQSRVNEKLTEAERLKKESDSLL